MDGYECQYNVGLLQQSLRIDIVVQSPISAGDMVSDS